MRQSLQNVTDVVQAPKTAAIAAGSTAGTGLAEIFGVVPWGHIASAIGAVCSLVLLVIQIWRFVLDRRRLILQNQIYEKQLKDGEG